MSIRLSDYTYHLPPERIAAHPLPDRDSARMLVYREGSISHAVFKDLPSCLSKDSLLIFNDTRVVQARLHFRRSTGALIEVFCLKPLAPFQEMSQAMQVKGQAVWECMAGNQRRWKEGESLELSLGETGTLSAKLLEKDGRYVHVEFQWPDNISWAEVLEQVGKLPLPPYIQREAEEIDKEDYQTVYARQEGAVAAPTAGLHFTDALLTKLEHIGIETARVTLHVGAGTFQPIEEEDVLQHPMHNEQIVFENAFIEYLANTERQVIAVGTTSMRALESLYWFGAQLLQDPSKEHFFIEKLSPYKGSTDINLKESLQAVLRWMSEKKLEKLWGQTEIFIMPGYRFRVCKGLITNFHLPQSTLLLLIAAFIGDDWKEVYAEALEKEYRFLSYGDGSLLLP